MLSFKNQRKSEPSSPTRDQVRTQVSPKCYESLDCDLAKCLFLVAKLKADGDISQSLGFKIKRFVIDEPESAKLRSALKSFESKLNASAFLRAIAGFMGLPREASINEPSHSPTACSRFEPFYNPMTNRRFRPSLSPPTKASRIKFYSPHSKRSREAKSALLNYHQRKQHKTAPYAVLASMMQVQVCSSNSPKSSKNSTNLPHARQPCYLESLSPMLKQKVRRTSFL